METLTVFLQANGPKQDSGILGVSTILLILFFIIYGIVKLYKKSKLIRHMTLIQSMRDNGHNSFRTIGVLNDVVRDMLKSDGVNVTDLKIVHEIGNRFNAILIADGKEYEMSITADRAGNVQYRIS